MPDPSKIRPQPEELIVREAHWNRWIGSPTEIGRIAAHVEHLINSNFLSFNDPEYRELLAAAEEQGYGEPSQRFIFSGSQIGTTKWARSPIRSEMLGAEIEARRDLTQRVHIESYVIERGWPVDIVDRVPLRDRETWSPHGNRGSFSEASVPPQQIDVWFQRGTPAAKLRVVAAGPMACDRLYGEIADRVAAGGRPKVWPAWIAGLTGGLMGALIAGLLIACSLVSHEPGIAIIAWLPAAGWLIGSSLIPWVFPPLELIDAWERSRWQKLKAWTFQCITLALAVAGIILAVLLAAPRH